MKKYCLSALFLYAAVCCPIAFFADDLTVTNTDQLIELMEEGDSDMRLQVVAKLARKQSNRALKAVVTASLHDPSTPVRKKASELLTDKKGREITEMLLEALEDEKPFVRSRAIVTLGNRREEKAREPLEEMVTDRNEVWYVRGKAARALAEIDDKRSISVLVRAMDERDSRVRLTVVESLGAYDDKRATRAVTGALKDREAKVRAMAAVVLANNEELDAVKDLIEALKTEEDLLPAGSMMDALQVITDADVDRTPEDWAEWWKQNSSKWR